MAALLPLSFFIHCAMTPPSYPSIWVCLGMVIGLYGLAGVALTVCTLARLPSGIAISTSVLFALFCPWTVWLGRTLPRTLPAPGGAEA